MKLSTFIPLKIRKRGASKVVVRPVVAQVNAKSAAVPWTLVKRGVRRKIITPIDAPEAFAGEAAQEREARVAAQDSALVRALGMAHHCQRLLDDGRFTSMVEIAQAEGLNLGRASTIARLVHLVPDVVEAC